MNNNQGKVCPLIISLLLLLFLLLLLWIIYIFKIIFLLENWKG